MTDISVVSGAFGMPDMFSQKAKEEKMNPETFTIEVYTYGNGKDVFTKVIDAEISEGFLRIVQLGGTITAYNTQDVTKTVSYEDS